jgi:Putative zinc-finger
MLSCRISGKQISRLVDNDLPEKDAIALRNHITACSDCSNRYNEYVNISGFVKHAFTETTIQKYVHVNSSKSVIPFDTIIKPAIAGLTAIVTFLVIISVVTIPNHTPGTFPVLSEIQPDNMNTPFGALLYYFEHDSTTVGSQFLTVSRGTIKSSTDTLQLTYSSPLFDDNSGIEMYSTERYR